MRRTVALICLYSIVAGSPAVASTANPKLSVGGWVGSFNISADGRTVVHNLTSEEDGVVEIYAVPIDGSAVALRIAGPMVSGPTGVSPIISPDDTRVVYRADQQMAEALVLEVYSVPIDGAEPPIKLSHPLGVCSENGVPCGTALECPDVGHCAVGGQTCLTDPDCPGMLNACLGVPQSCHIFVSVSSNPRIDPTSSYVMYQTHLSGTRELYSVPIDGSSPAVRLNGALVAGSDGIDRAEIASTGGRVVYSADQETDGVLELYSVPIDGSLPAVKLNGELVAGGGLLAWTIVPDGTNVLYTADQETDGVREVYVVPIDGSTLPVKLSSPMAGSASGTPLPSHDGTRVIYRVEQDTAALYEVYSAPLDASAPAIKLSHPLSPGDTAYFFWVSRDSPWVAYIASSGGIWEVYSVTIDGSLGPYRLHPTGVSDRWLEIRDTRVF